MRCIFTNEEQNHWNDIIFYWYQSYHWYQRTIRIALYPARWQVKIIQVPLMRCILTNYQYYHWYQWTAFLSPITPMESICEYWTTLQFLVFTRPIRAPEQILAGCQRKSVLQLAIQASCCYHVLAQKSF